jgi:cytochrome c oxidase assembly protein subunit 15
MAVLRIRPGSSYLAKICWIPLVLLTLQVLLGILVLKGSAAIVAGHWGLFEWTAQCHQLVGMLFMLVMVYMLFLIRPKPFRL